MGDDPGARLERHALNMGKLVGNLLMLELAARLFISAQDERNRVQIQIQHVKEGDRVPINPLTNGDDLRRTLEKYNKRAPTTYRLDIAPIVRLRDAIAHGCMFGFGSFDNVPRLVKFGMQKKSGTVGVTMVIDMTATWFTQNNTLVFAALNRVRLALGWEEQEFTRKK